MKKEFDMKPIVDLMHKSIESLNALIDDCPECEGTGICNFTCCGDDINDIGICKSCGEHSEAHDCAFCDGSGKVKK